MLILCFLGAKLWRKIPHSNIFHGFLLVLLRQPLEIATKLGCKDEICRKKRVYRLSSERNFSKWIKGSLIRLVPRNVLMNQGVPEPESVQRKDVQSFPGFTLQGRHYFSFEPNFRTLLCSFFLKKALLYKFICIFALAIRFEALMHAEVCGAYGWSTTY